MQKHISFGITSAVLLTAFVTVTLYTVNAAHAQGNASSAGGAAKNMTGGAAGAMKNATAGAMGKVKNATGK